jgi:hypothetical protein
MKIRCPEIAREIVLMAERDQKMRFDCQNPKKKAKFNPEIDRENTSRLKEIIDLMGWPTIDKVGEKAARGAWLIVQHADQDVEFQESCLDLMKQQTSGVSKMYIAYLTDRVAVNRGLEQTYGTQFCNDDKGELVPRPIKDREFLDKRRELMGLEPFEVYQKAMRRGYSWSKSEED